MDNININQYASDKLKELRLQKNMTQKELAEELNMTQQQIARYENNTRKFKQDLLFILADYFKVSINEFFPNPTKNKQDNEYYKKVLMKIGLIDSNGYIDEEKLNKLLKLIDEVE